MDKEELLKAIEQKRQEVRPTDIGEMKPVTVPNNLELGWLNALTWMEKFINSLSSEEEQMMKSAVDATCVLLPPPDVFKVLICHEVTDKLTVGQKVKVIIKEDDNEN